MRIPGTESYIWENSWWFYLFDLINLVRELHKQKRCKSSSSLLSSAAFIVQFLGWIQMKSTTPTFPAMERKSFISKKVNGNISYAEATVMKHNDREIVSNENQVNVVAQVSCFLSTFSIFTYNFLMYLVISKILMNGLFHVSVSIYKHIL